jgi:tRNA(Ile)-lysidine synthetase-like protein
MLNKILAFVRKYGMIAPGDHIICAVSGGADSVALAFALYLLKDKLDFRLSAAHFNHHLRGEESDRDETFVREFCDRYDIPLYVGGAEVAAGPKGLEAAARDARYTFLRTLPGKIATAHTADDNAETVLLHLIRGTGLKGLGGITPVRGNILRPMLTVTRQDVEAFLEEWCLPHREDSSNGTDAFLRNRLRHHVMPLLKEENPRLAENISAAALALRTEEEFLASTAQDVPFSVSALREAHPAIRARVLERFLKESGVREPEREHIALAEALVFSRNPSARGQFPGNITVSRQYDALTVLPRSEEPEEQLLPCPGVLELPGYRVICSSAENIVNTQDTFTVVPVGPIRIRPRQAGDTIRLPGGTKTLKKLFIDHKIPADLRSRIPIVADNLGILGVCGFGVHTDRIAEELPAVQIRFETVT